MRDKQSLDGPWQIIFDYDNVGEKEKWFQPEIFQRQDNHKTIQVPNCWETIERDYEGVAWYGREFSVPSQWENKVIHLHFNAVNSIAEVWLNGEVVGFHEGGYTPFEFDISDLVDFNQTNTLTLRVLGPIISRRDVFIDGIGKDELPQWRGSITGGIWQSVNIVATEHLYIHDAFIQPNANNGKVAIALSLNNKLNVNKDVEIKYTLYKSGEPGQILDQQNVSFSVHPGTNTLHRELGINNPDLWSPETPHLYNAKVQLLNEGRPLDEEITRFGFRDFTVKDNRFYLNGKQIFFKVGFWEGLYPVTLSFPPDAEMVKKEIRLAKEAGFNALRPWRKPPPPPILDLADEMGMMIIDCPPIECMNQYPKVVPQLRHRVFNEIREMVLRDRNHVSVVYWELFNEILRPPLGRLKREAVLLARDLDPTRVIVDESAGWAGGAHAYLPYSYEPLRINEVHNYEPAPVTTQTYRHYASLGRSEDEKSPAKKNYDFRSGIAPGKLTFLSEFGYGGLPDLESNVHVYESAGDTFAGDYRYHKRLLVSLDRNMKACGLNRIYKDVSALCLATQDIQAEANKLQAEALRINPYLAGYALHAFTGGDRVLGAGILDIWRNTKKSFYTIKEVQSPVYVAVRAEPSNGYRKDSVRFEITLVNDLEGGHYRLAMDVKDNNGSTIHDRRQIITIDGPITKVFEGKFPTNELSGRYTLGASIYRGEELVAENTYPFHVFEKELSEESTLNFAVFDPGNLLIPFLEQEKIGYADFSKSEEPLRSDIPVVVTLSDSKDENILQDVDRLMQFVEKGGSAIFLRPPMIESRFKWNHETDSLYNDISGNNNLIATGRFPLQLYSRPARGSWVGVYHGVQDHPVFDDLPVNRFMGQFYQNVCAKKTMIGLNVEPVVSSISWKMIRNYRAIEEAWWGSDMAVVPHGNGKILLSTLQIIEHLGSDPAADKIFCNLVRFSSQ